MAGFIFCIISVAAAGYFGVRLFALKRAVRAADEELRSITKEISSNRRMKFAVPDQDLEGFLNTLNGALEELWQERVAYERKEREFMQQIENISHDLRTPLTSILGYLELMDPEALGSGEKEAVEVIRRKAVTLKKLIGEFYDLTRLEAGDYQAKPERMDVNRFVRECTAGFYESLTKAGISVEMDLPEKPVFIIADEAALDRVISNLVQNAVRYADSTLEIKITESGSLVRILFKNDTRHLSEKDVLYLFDRFYQKEGARNQEGTGLGLTIAKYLTEEMGGVMDAVFGEEKLTIAMEFKKSAVLE